MRVLLLGVEYPLHQELRKVFLIELTCPAEEGIENAVIRKQSKYMALVDQINQRKGWSAKLMTIEVGARGFVSKSVWRCFSCIGLKRSEITKLCKALSLTAAKCSYSIYLAAHSRNWDLNKTLLGPDAI